jgi:C_GCAxxG_C_C family probable redox protein
MNNSTAEKVSEEAVKLFKSGFHCSEAVLLAFEKHTDKTFSDETKRGMSAFVEGIGGSGCICGALAGSVFVLSTMGGRLEASQSTSALEKIVKKLHDDFREEFKSACCRVITKNSSKIFGIGRFSSCPKTVAFCAGRIVQLAQVEGWIKKDNE